jgi:hypothetical protein
MTDRELLEMAAKAAGITLRWIQGPNDDECIHPIRRRDDGMCEVDWNPLTDDGDALRLAVKLGIDIETHGCNSAHPFACAFDCERNIAEEEQPDNGDPYAATRRAIVRAAAAIGAAAQKGTP